MDILFNLIWGKNTKTLFPRERNRMRNRLAHYLNPVMGEEQFGFMPDKGTSDAILALRNVIEKTEKTGRRIVDYAKAFDSVDYRALWKLMLDFGVSAHLVWLTKSLYDNAYGTIRVWAKSIRTDLDLNEE